MQHGAAFLTNMLRPRDLFVCLHPLRRARWYGGSCDPHLCALAPGAPPYVNEDMQPVRGEPRMRPAPADGPAMDGPPASSCLRPTCLTYVLVHHRVLTRVPPSHATGPADEWAGVGLPAALVPHGGVPLRDPLPCGLRAQDSQVGQGRAEHVGRGWRAMFPEPAAICMGDLRARGGYHRATMLASIFTFGEGEGGGPAWLRPSQAPYSDMPPPPPDSIPHPALHPAPRDLHALPSTLNATSMLYPPPSTLNPPSSACPLARRGSGHSQYAAGQGRGGRGWHYFSLITVTVRWEEGACAGACMAQITSFSRQMVGPLCSHHLRDGLGCGTRPHLRLLPSFASLNGVMKLNGCVKTLRGHELGPVTGGLVGPAASHVCCPHPRPFPGLCRPETNAWTALGLSRSAARRARACAGAAWLWGQAGGQGSVGLQRQGRRGAGRRLQRLLRRRRWSGLRPGCGPAHPHLQLGPRHHL